MTSKIYNVNVVSRTNLSTPEEIRKELPMSKAVEATVLQSRETICNIIDGTDKRLLVVVGPCSIHDVDAAHAYADRLRRLAEDTADSLFILMRVYFEKPRTTVGWKGLINDPDMDDSFHMEKGVRMARRLLLDLGEQGLPTATEALQPRMSRQTEVCRRWRSNPEDRDQD